MNETAKSRFLLDLDDLDRQLRQPVREDRSPRVDDPLAELARIVGQDDPFRDLLSGAGPARGAPPQRMEPTLDFGHVPLRGTHGHAPPQPAADPFEAAFERALLGEAGQRPASSGDQAFHHDDAEAPDGWSEPHQHEGSFAGGDAGHGGYAVPPMPMSAYDPRSFDMGDPAADEAANAPVRARRGRKGLIAVASVFVMAAAGVALAVNYTQGDGVRSGEPPLIKASADPIKIAPQNPGGVDIPNQNKQIYEGPVTVKKPADATVVRQSEQPVDVNQLLRTNSAHADAKPLNPDELPLTMPEGLETGNQTIPGLGEPRRVKTVAVRPDGSVINGAAAGEAKSAAQAPNAPGREDKPAAQTAASATTPGAPAAAAPQPAEPVRQAAPRSAPLSIVPQPQAQPAQPAPARVASAAPAVPASEPVTTAAVAPRGGDFTVQLAARPSEASARESFAQLQRRFTSLSGYQPIVRRAEVGDRTIYRLRVGPMSREDAAALCTSLQSQGGDCFVARN